MNERAPNKQPFKYFESQTGDVEWSLNLLNYLFIYSLFNESVVN
jgi:hypothetical protein